MPDLVEIAEKLKRVRNAQERFLAMWAVDCLLSEPQARARIDRDALSAGNGSSRQPLRCRGNVLNE